MGKEKEDAYSFKMKISVKQLHHLKSLISSIIGLVGAKPWVQYDGDNFNNPSKTKNVFVK